MKKIDCHLSNILFRPQNNMSSELIPFEPILFDLIPDDVLPIIFTFILTDHWRRSQIHHGEADADNNPHSILLVSKRFHTSMEDLYPKLFRSRFYIHTRDRDTRDYRFDNCTPEEFEKALYTINRQNKIKYIKIGYQNSALIILYFKIIQTWSMVPILNISMSTNNGECVWARSSIDAFVRVSTQIWSHDPKKRISDPYMFDMHERVLFSIFPEARKYFYQ